MFVAGLLFVPCITLVKASILCFYRQIFPTPAFGHCTLVVFIGCGAWSIVSFFVTIFQCSPIYALWDVELQRTTGKCMAAATVVLGIELSNVLLDVVILALPVVMVSRLQLAASRKFSIICIFLLGGL